MISAYSGFFMREQEDPEFNFDFRIKIHLPQTTKRMKLVIEKERDEIYESLVSDSQNVQKLSRNQSNSNSNYMAALSYLVQKTKFWETSVDSGMKLLLPLDPFIKVRVQKPIKTPFIDILLSQKFILYRQDGFSEITQLSFYKKFSDALQLELINALSWTDEEDFFNKRNTLALYHNLGPHRGISYILGANALLSPTFYYYSYDASVNLRQLLYKNWLFGYFSLGGEFLKAQDFKMVNFIQMRMEVLFR